MVVASGLLAIIVGGAFAVVLLTSAELRGTTDLRRQTREELVAADTFEKQVIDLETGLRGFVITRDESFLEPSNDARAALPASARVLERLAADEPVQLARVRRIVQAMNAYIRQHALPLVDAVRRNDPSVRSVERTVTGKQRVDALREGLNSFREAEGAQLSARDADVDQAAGRATAAAAVGVGGSILLILVFAGYLTRVIVQPLRRAALMADRLAGGDLSARMRENDIAEIGTLERSFNVMAGSLEKNQDELAALLAEQAALRRVATLVARGADPADVFAVTATEVCRLLGANATALCRYEPDATVTVLALETDADLGVRVGARITLEGENAMGAVFRTGRAARQDSFEQGTGTLAEIARTGRMDSSVGAPIVVEGRLWGVVVVSTRDRALPADTEQRLGDFGELVATTIANAESRAALGRVSDQQAALRRVATLIAQAAPPAEVFTAVADELGRLLGAHFSGIIRYEDDATVSTMATWAAVGEHPPVPDRWSTEPGDPATMIAETRQPARVEDWAAVPGPIAAVIREELGVSSSVGCPIVVEGRLWGALAVHSKHRVPLPPDTEARIAQFADLVATAIANTESHARADRLAEEQAALRRVATLVAKESPPAEVFAKVAEELANVLGDVECSLFRDEGDGTASAVALWGAGVSAGVRLGTRLPVDGGGVIASVLREGRLCRIGDYSAVTGAIAQRGRELGIRSAVGCPIVVGGRLWGAIGAARYEADAFPPEAETRVAQFAELVATAIANAEARTEVERLADEQVALRRVATLVAREAPQAEVFSSIAEEVRQLFADSLIYMFRYEDDRAAVAVASAGIAEDVLPVGSRHELGGKNAATRVFDTGEPVRIDEYAAASGPIAEAVRATSTRAVVGTPLVIDGRLWGVMVVGTTREERLPPETELRLGQFTGLMATAIANSESRARADRLADEQGALRRVATLVAEGASPAAVFDAVAGETEALLDADQVALNRFEAGDEILVLAHRGLDVARMPVGSRVSIEGESVTATVRRTGLPARMEDYDRAEGPLAELARVTGLRSSVSTPIVVEGRLWGLITASWKGEQSPPTDTEQRMSQFARLLGTAIANAEARSELMASRARVVAASDQARRRFERDLHDGIQQRLVSLSLELRGAEGLATSENTELVDQLSNVGDGLAEALDDLRELSRGIHPAILTEGGLAPALKALARRSSVPVELELAVEERLADQVEVGVYYVVSEALTNAAKHARASKVEVHARASDGVLELTIGDDGVGGADPVQGSGLTGLADRVEALGGAIAIASPPGEGTSLRVELPLGGR